jgi:hypothetical protein
MAIRISATGKMPYKSWSLQAIDTCPGSIGPDGDLVPACRGCYATTGNYRFPNVIAPRMENREDWKRGAWVDDMVHLLRKETHFRWFDSGDCYHIQLGRKILEVMRLTPHVQHWLPTRMYKFAKFERLIDSMNALPNVVVRLSSDDIDGSTVSGRFTSTIFDPEHDVLAKPIIVCGAYTRKGKCGDCRACWDRRVSVVAYPQHGRNMSKVNDALRLQVTS